MILGDLGTYEIILKPEFDTVLFEERAKSGLDGFWGICLEHEPDMWRFKGVLLPEYSRVFIDIPSDGLDIIAYVTTPQNEKLTPSESAKRVYKLLNGIKMYKDGVEVEL